MPQPCWIVMKYLPFCPCWSASREGTRLALAPHDRSPMAVEVVWGFTVPPARGPWPAATV